MTIPVLICDDSGFARKQITQALPKHWDADLFYAQNGQEALELIRMGKADALFLDLTMPVMDGFEVLETIHREDLPTLPIVISGIYSQTVPGEYKNSVPSHSWKNPWMPTLWNRYSKTMVCFC